MMAIDVTVDRHKGIGGSEAGIIAGVNKYKSVHDLWLEKTGRKENNFKGNEATEFGKKMEPILFDTFKTVNHMKYIATYDDRRWNSYADKFMFAHVDGLLEELGTGRKGILEIKTAKIMNKSILDDWSNQIPDSYYCQILHYMAVTGTEFAVVYAYLDIDWLGKQELRTYHFERDECQEDIDYLIQKEKEFWNKVTNDIEPEFINTTITI